MPNVKESDNTKDSAKATEQVPAGIEREKDDRLTHASAEIKDIRSKISVQKNPEGQALSETTRKIGGKPEITDGEKTVVKGVVPLKPGDTLNPDDIKKAASGSLEEASAQVARINDPDKNRQSQLRAEATVKIIGERVTTTNQPLNLVADGNPGGFSAPVRAAIGLRNVMQGGISNLGAMTGLYDSEPSPLQKNQALEVLRNTPGVDSAGAAWTIKAAKCQEHGALVQKILEGAGEKATMISVSDKADPGPNDNLHTYVILNMQEKPGDLKNPSTFQDPRHGAAQVFKVDSWGSDHGSGQVKQFDPQKPNEILAHPMVLQVKRSTTTPWIHVDHSK